MVGILSSSDVKVEGAVGVKLIVFVLCSCLGDANSRSFLRKGMSEAMKRISGWDVCSKI